MTLGHWDSRICGDGYRRGDSWDHLEVNSRLVQNLALLATPSEQEGVTALEPHHGSPVLGFLHQKLVYPLLCGAGLPRVFAHVDLLAFLGYYVQYSLCDKSVIEQHIGVTQEPMGLHRYQFRVPGT